MDIKRLIEQDVRVMELKKQYQYLLNKKNALILDISNVEADIIKTMGAYEAVAKDILAKFECKDKLPVVDEGPEPMEPVEDAIPEENEDDGFAEAKEVIDMPVTAETDRPNKIE